MTASKNEFVGVGLYTIPEAARFTRIPANKIRGWINGYGGRSPSRERPAAIIRRQIPSLEGKPALGFLDLIEVRFVNWLLGYGVSWKTIRQAAALARDTLKHEHPFALANFHTDGKGVFLETQKDTGDRMLLDLVKNNFAMYDVLEQSFRAGIEFGSGVAARWRPPSDYAAIVLDPLRSFGQPIDENSGVPTATLFDAYRAEGSFERVAEWYDVTIETVRAAVAFELKLAA